MNIPYIVNSSFVEFEGLFLTVQMMDGRYKTGEVSLYNDSSRARQINEYFAFNALSTKLKKKIEKKKIKDQRLLGR